MHPRPRLAPAVLVVGSHTGHCGDGLVAEGAQFGQVGQHHRRRGEADAGDGVEPVRLGLEFFIGGDEFGDGFLALGHLFLQRLEQAAGLAAAERSV